MGVIELAPKLKLGRIRKKTGVIELAPKLKLAGRPARYEGNPFFQGCWGSPGALRSGGNRISHRPGGRGRKEWNEYGGGGLYTTT